MKKILFLLLSLLAVLLAAGFFILANKLSQARKSPLEARQIFMEKVDGTLNALFSSSIENRLEIFLGQRIARCNFSGRQKEKFQFGSKISMPATIPDMAPAIICQAKSDAVMEFSTGSGAEVKILRAIGSPLVVELLEGSMNITSPATNLMVRLPHAFLHAKGSIGSLSLLRESQDSLVLVVKAGNFSLSTEPRIIAPSGAAGVKIAVLFGGSLTVGNKKLIGPAKAMLLPSGLY